MRFLGVWQEGVPPASLVALGAAVEWLVGWVGGWVMGVGVVMGMVVEGRMVEVGLVGWGLVAEMAQGLGVVVLVILVAS